MWAPSWVPWPQWRELPGWWHVRELRSEWLGSISLFPRVRQKPASSNWKLIPKMSEMHVMQIASVTIKLPHIHLPWRKSCSLLEKCWPLQIVSPKQLPPKILLSYSSSSVSHTKKLSFFRGILRIRFPVLQNQIRVSWDIGFPVLPVLVIWSPGC